MGCAFYFFIFWAWKELSPGTVPGLAWLAFYSALSVALNNFFLSKLSAIGTWFTVGETTGITLALSIFLWPLSFGEVLFVWTGICVVAHYSSLVRISRLKKLGFVDPAIFNVSQR